VCSWVLLRIEGGVEIKTWVSIYISLTHD